MMLLSLCWCGSAEVPIPVGDIGRVTGSCDRPECEPGCDLADHDDYGDYDDHDDPSSGGYSADQNAADLAQGRPWFTCLSSRPMTTQTHHTRRAKMNHFKPANYTPRTDESAIIPAAMTAANPGDLHLLASADPNRPMCGCGCGETPKGKKAQFAMGHDIRLRGKLMRVGAAGGRVRTVWALGDVLSLDEAVVSPVDFAATFSTERMDWRANVSEGIARIQARVDGIKATSRAVLARAAGPAVGDKTLIKVGRWEKTGQIAAIYRIGDADALEVEYVDAKGNARRARKVGGGKWTEIKGAVA